MKSLVKLLLVLLLAATGLALLGGGIALIAAGGSLYYLLAGAAILASAVLLALGHGAGVVLYGAALLATLAWSLWEVGLDGWALAPRLLFLAVLGLLFLLPPVRRLHRHALWWAGGSALACFGVIGLATLLAAQPPANVQAQPTATASSAIPPTDADELARTDRWHHWGKSAGGMRYLASDQIDRDNVHQLELAWRYGGGVTPPVYLSFEATPLLAAGRLYVCLKPGIVAALDPDSGEELWRYTASAAENVDFTQIFGGKCRGVSYFEAPPEVAECPHRIITVSPDGYLIALDAADGRLCPGFGDAGRADLHAGIGPLPQGARHEILAMPSSPPAIVNGVAVVGQTVSDLESLDAPSGVIRGYDAVSGELKWAWDAGRPGQTQLEPGQHYTRNTPNAWGVLSGDDALGLVYVPTGNSLPDYYGGQRPAFADQYASAVVAIDVATGLVRWSFQTVHHDTWDYDIGAQPVTVDLAGDEGAIPALLVATKLGQIYVLDRRSGEPVDDVVERPVPREGAVDGERLSGTQPYTTGFPSLSGPDLTEADMWGVSPFDQLWCRVLFRKAHYLGQFTPIGTRDTLMYPGTAGGINWGSVAVDPHRQLLFVNTLRFANLGRLVPRDHAPADGYGGKEGEAVFEQRGTPYAFIQSTFMSPLKVPCQRPPYGTVNVLDLASRELLWSAPFGTAATAGPLGIESRLPLRLGAPNMGGAVVTAGGLAFIGASLDRRLRAFDMESGRELWSASLPAVAAANPMSYVSPKTGRQYVVIAAGGHYGLPGPAASAVLAYALPGTNP